MSPPYNDINAAFKTARKRFFSVRAEAIQAHDEAVIVQAAELKKLKLEYNIIQKDRYYP